MAKSDVWKLSETIWHPAFQKICIPEVNDVRQKNGSNLCKEVGGLNLRHVVTGVDAGAFRVDATHLSLVVADRLRSTSFRRQDQTVERVCV